MQGWVGETLGELDAIVAGANDIEKGLVQTLDPTGRCRQFHPQNLLFSSCLAQDVSKNQILGYGTAIREGVESLGRHLQMADRLARECDRHVGASCRELQQVTATLMQRIQRDAAMAGTLSGVVSAARIQNSIARQQQQITWDNARSRAGEFARGYREWANAAARDNRSDQAASYTASANQWAAVARSYR
jgi:hypothetical protein